MDPQFRQLVYETFGEVFETMFFTFLAPLEELAEADIWDSGDGYLRAAISYHGPHAGSFALYLPRRLARNITMNFLGADEKDINEEQMLDTAKETANMAVGSLLGEVDPAGESKLHIPEAMVLEQFNPAQVEAEPGLFLFNTDFGSLWVVYKR